MKKHSTLVSILIFCSAWLAICDKLTAQPTFFYHSNQHINTTAAAGTASTEVLRDAAGNLFSAGIFSGTTDFDPGPGVFNLTTSQYLANYIAKYSPAGALLWAKKIEPNQSTSFLLLHGICVDNAGELILFGAVGGVVDMDPGPGVHNISEIDLAAGNTGGDVDPFVAKYSAAGDFLWAWSIGAVMPGCGQGCVDFHAWDVEVDASNTLFVYGDFQNNFWNNFDFDPSSGTAFLPQNGFTDCFIAKYTPAGAFLEAINLGGSNDDFCSELHLTSGGTVTVTGGFSGSGDFDPGGGTANLTSNGPNLDVFAARYTAANLDFVWAVGGDGSVEENEMYGNFDEDAAGNLYITSSIRGVSTADFDPGAGVFNITGQGQGDIVFLKLNGSGVFQWAKHLATASYEGALDLELDGSGNPWLNFRFYGNLDIDPGAGSTVLNSNGVGSALVKYTPAGNLGSQFFDFSGQNVQNYFETTNHYFYDTNTILVDGRLRGTVDINPDPGIESVSSSAAAGTWLLAKLTPNQLWLSPNSKNVAAAAGSTTFDIVSNVSWTASSSATWATVSPASGSNNGTLTVNFAANPGDQRTATISLSSGGQTRKVTLNQASGLVCETFMSTDVPKIIDPNSSNTVLSTLSMPATANIVDLDVVGLNIQHGWIADLMSVKLLAPSGSQRELFSNICTQGTASQLNSNFDDEATATLGANCPPPVLTGPYQPLQNFAAFDGQNPNGTWTLSIFDIAPQIGGTLNAWGVKVCYLAPPPSGLSVSIFSENISCNGAADGTATASATGGTGNITFLWSNGATSASLQNLAPGTFTVTATDGNGATATASTSISQPAVLQANVTGNSNAGTATSSPSGGTSPYIFLWSNGQTFPTIQNLSIGTYTCTTTDDAGCTASGSVTLTPACGMPLNLVETDLTSNSVKLNWQNMGAVQYQVQFKQNGQAWTTTTLTANFLIVNNLNPHKTHSWRVRAKCGATWTIYSPIRTFTTPDTGSTCTSPTNLAFSNITSSSALVSWAAAPGATSYQIKRKAAATGSSWATYTTSVPQFQLSNLISNMTYSVQVRTKCGSTWFPWTPVYNFQTFVSKPAPADDRAEFFENFEDKSAQNFDLKIYPNPAHEFFNLNIFSKNENPENAKIEIFDASGRLVFQDFWQIEQGENGFQILTSDFPKGIFWVKIRVGENVETRQLVVF